jgi:hypothetical protein
MHRNLNLTDKLSVHIPTSDFIKIRSTGLQMKQGDGRIEKISSSASVLYTPSKDRIIKET